MIDLYKPSPSPLAMHYPIMIDGDITDTQDYREEFDMILQASEGDLITILISSNGGSLSTGLRFYSLLKETPAHTVAIIETHAHSAASIIALGCDEIRAQPYAEMLIHSCSYGTGGSHPDIKAYVNHSEKMMNKIIPEVYQGFLSEDKIAEVLRGEQVWLFADEIQEAIKIRDKYFQEKYEADVKETQTKSFNLEGLNELYEEVLTKEQLLKLTKAELAQYVLGEISVDVDDTGKLIITKLDNPVDNVEAV